MHEVQLPFAAVNYPYLFSVAQRSWSCTSTVISVQVEYHVTLMDISAGARCEDEIGNGSSSGPSL